MVKRSTASPTRMKKTTSSAVTHWPTTERGDHTQGHQRVRDDLFVEGGSHDIAEDGEAGDQHDDRADGQRDQCVERLEQPQPLAADHDEEHRREEASEQEAGLAREGGGRAQSAAAGGPRSRHGVAGAFHRRRIAGRSTWAGSRRTIAFSEARKTSTDTTPGTSAIAWRTCWVHSAQSMPLTGISRVASSLMRRMIARWVLLRM